MSKRKPRPDDTRRPVADFPLGTTVRYPDGRLVKLTADLCGDRWGREVKGGRLGELGNWINPATTVELVAAYEPTRLDNTNTETDPLIAGERG